MFAASSGMTSFVTRNGARLMLDGEVFRFAGANLYWLGLDENVVNETTGSNVAYPTDFRIDDGLATAAEMGANVVRAHTLGVSTGNTQYSFEGSKGTFNDAAAERMDFAIARAQARGIRLIIPLTDNYDYYHGGKVDFVRWAGIEKGEPYSSCILPGCVTESKAAHCAFYSDAGALANFRRYVRQLLLRRNRYTNVTLVDDPTVLAWETGNELVGVPPAWTRNITAFIRHDLGAQQLIMDGRDGVRMGYGDGALRADVTPDVDLVTEHYYMDLARSALPGYMTPDARLAAAHDKVFTIGEYGWNKGNLTAFLAAVRANTNVSGDLFWSLFPHADGHGFVSHSDGYSLHYPGGAKGSAARSAARVLRAHAYAMRGIDPAPPASACDAPLITSTRGQLVAWRGAAGADVYTVQRRGASGASWSTVCDACASDLDTPWRDATRPEARTVWYRVRAINMDSVAGKWSEPFLSPWTPPPPSPAPTPAPPPAPCSFLADTDCSGGSHGGGGTLYGVATASACCNACSAKSACGSAIFQPSQQKCFLKPADCTPVHKGGVTSCTPKPQRQ